MKQSYARTASGAMAWSKDWTSGYFVDTLREGRELTVTGAPS